MKNKILKVLDFVIYWSIIITPFSVAIAPGLANTFIGLFSACFIIKKITLREKLLIGRGILFPFAAIIVFALLSFWNSISWADSFTGIIKFLKGFIIVVVCFEEIKDLSHVRKIIFSICCAITLISVDALWQLAAGKDFITGEALASNYGMARASASFPNCNVFGVYIGAITPLVLGLALFYFKGIKKFIMLLIAFLGTTGIATTLSRGTGLGFYLSTLFMSILKKNKLLITLLVAAVLISPFVMPKEIKKWAKEVNYNVVVFMCNPDRIYIYKTTVNMIKDHPLVGVGVNTFCHNYGKYKVGKEEPGWETGETKYAHNIYLHMAGEIGLLGLAAFLWFLFAVFKSGLRSYRRLKDDYLKTVALSLLGCLIAFLVNGLTETSLYYARVSMIFWYLAGFLLALSRFYDAQTAREN